MIDSRYVAGLFDGEGCVSINKVSAKNYARPGFQLRCTITNTNREVLELVAQKYGGSVKSRGQPDAREYFVWTVVARKARNFLKEVLPNLIIKIDQALAGIEFQDTRDNRSATRKTDAEWQSEFELYERVRRGNARYGTEYYTGS